MRNNKIGTIMAAALAALVCFSGCSMNFEPKDESLAAMVTDQGGIAGNDLSGSVSRLLLPVFTNICQAVCGQSCKESYMSKIPTPHIEVTDQNQIAKTVLMPGDPLRAKFIAETFLENPVQINGVRNMLAYTGTYKGKKVTVFGSGMGMPSIGIYSYELFNFYDVDTIIRIGSAGGIADGVELRDLVVGIAASTDSNYASQYKLPGTIAPTADFGLARKAVETAEKMGIAVKAGNILSSDIFYNDWEKTNEEWKKMGILAVEMESCALYLNAARAGKKALCLCTISDKVFTGESLSSTERQLSFTDMMKVALELA